MSHRRYIDHSRLISLLLLGELSIEFTGLNKNTYEEKANNIVKNIEWIKNGIIVFGIETEIDENTEEDRVILFIL
ncbi:hypothetical protein L0Y26_12175 [Pectobacterium aroidearum]|uniref:hypothetical protein n=1 Tax=Pectobacterium aroidearum TaxID=1201031 RepID=UPI002113C664|nr:hypothetical protein [Pectobacterium aroidearum]UUE34475.1 hypothetical protein L0Y26_12175 [Pectobacterium aroidearum]UUE38853.1 hypothetical protein L0Y25_12180 [Pectobacterium aroidearum]